MIDASRFDPGFLRARREAIIILIAWAVCLIWTVGYCGVAGYANDSEAIALLFGMPRWVVWGILAPWIAATLFSTWFSLCHIADESGHAQSDG